MTVSARRPELLPARIGFTLFELLVVCSPGSPYFAVPMCAGDPSNWTHFLSHGIMGANASASLDDIRDGTSKTTLVAELRAGVVPGDLRGTWAFSGAGASSFWNFGLFGGQPIFVNNQMTEISRTVVPEPGTASLLWLGLVGIAGVRWHRRHRRA